MIRILWPLAMAALGVIALGAQLDRQSRIDPSLAKSVPAPARGFAQEEIVRELVVAGESDAALEAARVLIAARPMPAEHLSMLAQAELLAGENERSVILAQRAAHRSWRDEPTQLLIFQLAATTGDDKEMARRLGALWAIHADRDLLNQVTRLVLSRPEARAEFTSILAQNPRWKRQLGSYTMGELPTEQLDAPRPEQGVLPE